MCIGHTAQRNAYSFRNAYGFKYERTSNAHSFTNAHGFKYEHASNQHTSLHLWLQILAIWTDYTLGENEVSVRAALSNALDDDKAFTSFFVECKTFKRSHCDSGGGGRDDGAAEVDHLC